MNTKKIEEIKTQAIAKCKECEKVTVDYTKKNPKKALGIAAAVGAACGVAAGVVAGILLGRKKCK